ncbi:MAG TPA: PilZ domain-containing protein [Afifellaceae bacterium]|nr:PilZ domain-containing protein [Afifellaceae bacterium]
MDQDRRTEPRLRTLQTGRIVFNRASSTFDCLVRDMSERGARLRFGDILALPAAFELMIGGKGTRLPARIAWRKGAEAGVVFD